MKKLLALSFIGVLGLPLTSFAATYHYLDVNGTVHDVNAPSAQQALTYVNALPSTIHSGVALDQGRLNAGENYGHYYQYRTKSGAYNVVLAATLDAARTLATDRASDSGFVIVQ
jgi:hypothetical protein